MMTGRQRVLRLVYPLFMRFKKRFHKSGEAVHTHQHPPWPQQSFHQLSAREINGSSFSFEALKGKKVLIVNTASNCGYTPQYAELAALQQLAGDKLVVLVFPSSDFRNQEPLDNDAIKSFCNNYYPSGCKLMEKIVVKQPTGQHPVFHWLSQASANGWLDQAPTWNFCKYLVDEQGRLSAFYPPYISPVAPEVKKAIL